MHALQVGRFQSVYRHSVATSLHVNCEVLGRTLQYLVRAVVRGLKGFAYSIMANEHMCSILQCVPIVFLRRN